jgi:hypothetical protein
MSKSEKSLYQELEKGIGELKHSIEKFPLDACERTVLKVLQDKKVQEAIVKEFSDHDMYLQSVKCEGEHDQIKVIFTFECIPPKMCFLAHIITVTYDASTGKVVGIDHFP